ncbi:MAG: hypothetical protein NZM33_08965 [Bryobacteraceae bacterium]|nr:hypothetical protein [Bryobacteraceae bacterium]
MLSLAGLSVLTGIGMLWVFGRLSDQEAIRAVKRELAACLYEIRLFADEPSLIWRAQKHLLTRNLRYLALMLRPALALTAPMVLLLIHLDAFFGRAPIPPGQAALVKVQLERAAPLEAALETPAGVAVETLPVRLPEQWQLVWRIRPSREMVGTLRLRVHDRLYEKQLVAGAPPRYLTSQRVRSFWSWVAHSGEARLPEGPVRAIEIVYPPAKLSWGPLQFHWLVWFLLLSLAAAWALRGPFDVTL